MSATPPPVISPVPLPAPQRGDRPTFSDRVDAFVTWLTAAVAQFGAVATNAYSNAVDAFSSATAAAGSAADANSAALAAASSAGAVKWVSGTTYADGTVTWSPITRFSYRRVGAGSGTTDPSNDAVNWVLLMYGSGIGSAVVTGNIALTNATGGAISVTPSAPGLYAILPDATTMAKAALSFTVRNEGVYDYGLKDFTGTQLGWVRAGGTAQIGNVTNTTQAGKWSTNLQKLGVTALLNIASTQGSSLRRTTIDANRTLFLFGALYAVIYDASSQTWGAPLLVRSIPNGALASAVLVATDTVLVMSSNNITGLQAIVLSLTGVSIAPNSPVAATAGSNVTQWGSFEPVSTSYGISYVGTSGSYIRAVTVLGTVPTIGAEIVFSTASVLPLLFAVGAVLRAVGYDGTSNLTCRPYTVTATVLTFGTANVTGSLAPSAGAYRAFLNGNSNIVVFYNNGSALYAAVFKLTGTAESVSIAQLSTGNTDPSFLDYVAVTSTKTAVASCPGAGTTIYWNIHVDTAGTSSCGTEDSLTLSAPKVSALGVSGNNARFAVYNASDAFAPMQLQFDCSGASPVRGNSQTRGAVNSPAASSSGKSSRHFSLLTAGTTQYAIGGLHALDGSFNSVNIQALPSLGENYIAGANGAAASESWLLSGLTASATLGTTIKRIEAAA